jgi:predicted nucleic acid-binding protein
VRKVLDSSALVNLLVGTVRAVDLDEFEADLTAPDIVVAETASGLRRSERRGVLAGVQAQVLLAQVLAMPIELVDSRDLIEGAFELRHTMTVQDACYVALAEQLGCGLLTSDARLARSPGITVPVTVV